MLILTVLLYGLAAVWIWRRQDYFRVSLAHISVAFLGPLFSAILINGFFQPLKYRLLLRLFGANPSFASAFKDRMLIVSLKWATPFRIGEVFGYLSLTKKHGLNYTQMPAFLIMDKSLTLLAVLVLWVAALVSIHSGALVSVASALAAALLLLLFPGRARGLNTSELQAPPQPREEKNKFSLNHVWQEVFRSLAALGRLTFGKRMLLLILALCVVMMEILGFAFSLSFSLREGWSSLRFLDLMIVQLVADIPISLGGAGSREAAALVVFDGRGDPGLLFIAAFSVTLFARLLPALIGILYSSRLLKNTEEKVSA